MPTLRAATGNKGVPTAAKARRSNRNHCLRMSWTYCFLMIDDFIISMQTKADKSRRTYPLENS